MGKSLFIAEKPSVAQEFAKALKKNVSRKDGYMEGDDVIVTWCVGHLVTMSYPEAYDAALRSWRMETLPFIPESYKYEVIPNVKKQFDIVAGLLNRPDVDTIYVCTDSGREGEYIYRLVEQEAHVVGKNRRRVWIDSQTEEEIKRGIAEAKDLSAYDNLGASAYLRAKEDYLMGINFSRLLTLKFGNQVARFLNEDRGVISIGRVMTCVLGMVVRREREIRNFQKTMYYRVNASFSLGSGTFSGEWKTTPDSFYDGSPALYKENGFKKREDAEALITRAKNEAERTETPAAMEVLSIERKTEKKNAPLLYNLAELQNDCSRRFKISPDETLRIIQDLYEKKLVTYPRTDARVLSTAVAKEIDKNIKGLLRYEPAAQLAQEALDMGTYKNIAKTKYTNDKQITDHYAVIPTGQGFNELPKLSHTAAGVYDMIVRRFLSIFFPPAVYKKIALDLGGQPTLNEATGAQNREHFFSNFKILTEEGYFKVTGIPGAASKKKTDKSEEEGEPKEAEEEENDLRNSPDLQRLLEELKKGSHLPVQDFAIRESETQPPARYNSGTLILAMENAGQLIEDEELRAQIKGSGIGTSATRAEILKKLVTIQYLHLNKKTQIITPTFRGELVYEVVATSMPQMLNPDLTASWEKGLSYVAEGTISEGEYMQKLSDFITRRCVNVKKIEHPEAIHSRFAGVAPFYRKGA